MSTLGRLAAAADADPEGYKEAIAPKFNFWKAGRGKTTIRLLEELAADFHGDAYTFQMQQARVTETARGIQQEMLRYLENDLALANALMPLNREGVIFHMDTSGSMGRL